MNQKTQANHNAQREVQLRSSVQTWLDLELLRSDRLLSSPVGMRHPSPLVYGARGSTTRKLGLAD